KHLGGQKRTANDDQPGDHLDSSCPAHEHRYPVDDVRDDEDIQNVLPPRYRHYRKIARHVSSYRPLLVRIASATRPAARVARGSWTRTIEAPLSTASAFATALPNSTSRWESPAIRRMKVLREVPTNTG